MSPDDRRRRVLQRVPHLIRIPTADELERARAWPPEDQPPRGVSTSRLDAALKAQRQDDDDEYARDAALIEVATEAARRAAERDAQWKKSQAARGPRARRDAKEAATVLAALWQRFRYTDVPRGALTAAVIDVITTRDGPALTGPVLDREIKRLTEVVRKRRQSQDW